MVIKGEIHGITTTVGVLLSTHINGRSSRQKINNEIMALNVTLDEINLQTFIERSTPKLQNTHFLQVHKNILQDRSHVRPQNKSQ